VVAANAPKHAADDKTLVRVLTFLFIFHSQVIVFFYSKDKLALGKKQ
jgi:hypothetical protein